MLRSGIATPDKTSDKSVDVNGPKPSYGYYTVLYIYIYIYIRIIDIYGHVIWIYPQQTEVHAIMHMSCSCPSFPYPFNYIHELLSIN